MTPSDDSGWSPPDVDEESYVFTSSLANLPANPLLMPSVGNGHISTIIYHDKIFMNGLYNGEGKKSHRAAIPALNRIKLKARTDATSTFSLDCIKGTFYEVQSGKDVQVQHLVCAHKTIPSLLVNQIRINRTDQKTLGTEVTISIEVGSDFLSPDLSLTTLSETDKAIEMVGQIRETELPGDMTTQIRDFYIKMDKVPASLILAANCENVTYTYLMSVNSTQAPCLYQYDKGVGLQMNDELLPRHYQGWYSIWQEGRIDVWSDETRANQVVYGCQYYLLSSLPAQFDTDCTVHEFYGLSPESLSCGDGTGEDYLGHVFWDQETWMYPAILFLHVDIARELLSTRLRVVEQAKSNAQANLKQGVQFSWEQAVTGIPVSPSDDCEKYELHISADIALALRQFFYITGTLTDSLTDLSQQLSEYWVSRLSWLEDKQKYGVLGVMPPDEWHYPVNNSAYTNMAAKLAISLPSCIQLQSAIGAQGTLKAPICPDVYIPFDDTLNYHPEYDGYSVTDPKKSEVKQADVILIGYPLDAETNKNIRENDLDLYEGVTTKDGPAMTWSMFCIGHMELGQPMKAAEMYERQLLQATRPFQVWSEYPDGTGAINFITGMGGFLQSLLNGYVGIRARANGIRLHPALPPNNNRLKVTGFNYRGAKFDIDIQKQYEKTVMRTDENSTLGEFYISTTDSKLPVKLVTKSPVCLDDSESLLYQCSE